MAEQILASYVIENVRNTETGETFCRRTCTHFSAFELLGMLDFARHDIYEQITKRDLVDRVRIEYRDKEE